MHTKQNYEWIILFPVALGPAGPADQLISCERLFLCIIVYDTVTSYIQWRQTFFCMKTFFFLQYQGSRD